jgi:hypothetical protein
VVLNFPGEPGYFRTARTLPISVRRPSQGASIDGAVHSVLVVFVVAAGALFDCGNQSRRKISLVQ